MSSPVRSAALSLDGSLIAVATDDAVRLFRASGVEQALEGGGSAGGTVHLLFTPGGEFSTVDGAGRLQVWEAATGRRLSSRLLRSQEANARAEGVLSGGLGLWFRIDGSRYSADLSRIVYWGYSRNDGRAAPGPPIRVLDVASGALVKSFEGHGWEDYGDEGGDEDDGPGMGSRYVWDAAFAPDGRTLVSTGGDDFRTWDMATGRERWSARGLGTSTSASALVFSPEGLRLAAAGSWNPGWVVVHDVATGRRIREVEAGSLVGHEILALGFAPDDRIVALVTTKKPSATVVLLDVTGYRDKAEEQAAETATRDRAAAAAKKLSKFKVRRAGAVEEAARIEARARLLEAKRTSAAVERARAEAARTSKKSREARQDYLDGSLEQKLRKFLSSAKAPTTVGEAEALQAQVRAIYARKMGPLHQALSAQQAAELARRRAEEKAEIARGKQAEAAAEVERARESVSKARADRAAGKRSTNTQKRK
ncbi:MAG: hypothetical protein FD180_3059 [Planctomycetota bacterium]|nr:MAG: hypothetical protein FD180_3059 [Planctomycetota bacterium]